ncbi:MAG: hypothetical protein IJK81_13415 [Selenomonadaceae bacterium]|nr:hypothetical protein [Selenomonadaceae bacterium]
MATTEERLSSLEAKFESFMQEVHDMRQEMRDRDNRRAAEIAELRQRQDAMQAQHNAEVKGALKHIQNLTIASMVGIAAIAGATWAFMWSSTRNETPPQSPPAQTAQAATQNNPE